MNQIGEALKQLQQENQQLREIVAEAQNKPRLAIRPPAATTRRPAGKKPGATVGAPAAAPPAAETPAAAAPAPGTPPAASAPAPAAPAGEPPPAPAGQQASAPPGDAVGGLLNTVGRTREAIESLRKVPETFENVLGKKK
jgi:hypothetical protein